MDISERSFEETIEAALVGPPVVSEIGAAPFGLEYGASYRRRLPTAYDRSLCLIPQDVLDFIYATQPKEWTRLKEYYGVEVKEKFLKRLTREVEARGMLDVLRRD
jgi:type I restriction enzyme R subunit